MVLTGILLGTLFAGIGSVWLAAALSFGALAGYTQRMLSFAAGALLATAFVHLLPEAFDTGASSHALFVTILAGFVFFFLLDKAELWHHGHEHAPQLPTLGDAMDGNVPMPAPAQSALHAHAHDDARPPRAAGSWSVLFGDGMHSFGDGVLIASAFVAALPLGVMASLAVLAHEVPHHMGDLAVLRVMGASGRRSALLKVSLAGAATALGGIAGYWLLGHFDRALPYLVVLAASSFIYVALADLIPQLQQRLPGRQTLAQLLWLGMGIALVTAVRALAHAAGHG